MEECAHGFLYIGQPRTKADGSACSGSTFHSAGFNDDISARICIGRDVRCIV